MEPHDDVAVAHGDELVQRVEHRQQVERDLVVRIVLERGFERGARLGFVAGAQQMGAEIGERARIAVERQTFARQRHRLVEPVVVRGQLARRPIHVAVVRRDRQRLRYRRVEVLRLVVDERDGGHERVRFEVRRIDLECLGQQIPGFVAPPGIDCLLGKEDVGLDR